MHILLESAFKCLKLLNYNNYFLLPNITYTVFFLVVGISSLQQTAFTLINALSRLSFVIKAPCQKALNLLNVEYTLAAAISNYNFHY